MNLKDDEYFLNKKSILSSYWYLAKKNNDVENFSLYLNQIFNIPFILGPFLYSIGINKNNIKFFLETKLSDYLPDPNFFKDMDITVKRLANQIENRKSIGIFGDYDVDGATSAALLKIYFNHFRVNTFIHIPDRFLEGYGPNENALNNLIAKGSDLIITVDCGINSYQPLLKVSKRKIDVIIVDHHLPDSVLPKAFSIINPKRIDNKKGYEYLCSAGIVFVMLIGLNRELRNRNFFTKNNISEPRLVNFLDLVALGTVCDVVPIKNLNRAFVKQGIKVMQQRKNLGIKILSDISNLSSPPNEQSMSYSLGPRINAAGRIGSSKLGVDLLTENNEDVALTIALKMNKLNEERKILSSSIESEAIGIVESNITNKNQINSNIIIVYNEGWHEGVIGIVAGKLKEKYNKPCCVITFNGRTGKGSGRSIPGFSIGDLFNAAKKNGLLVKAGGHDMAAGLTIKKSQLKKFQEFSENYSLKKSSFKNLQIINAAEILPVSACNLELANWIDKLGPWGEGASEPKFIIKDSEIKNIKKFGKNKEHAMFNIYDNGNYLNCKKFFIINSRFELILKNCINKRFNFLGNLKIDKFSKKNIPEFHLLDIMD